MLKKSAIAVALVTTLTGSAFAATKQKNDVAMAKTSSPARVAANKKASRISTAKLAPTRTSPLYAQATLPQSVSTSAASATRASAPTTAGSTVVKAEQIGVKKASFLDKLSSSAEFSYYGSTIMEPTAGYQPNPDTGYDDSAVAVEAVAKVGYKLTDNLKLTLAPAFTWVPNHRKYVEKTDSYKAIKGKMFEPIASSVRLGVGKFAQAGGFKWSGDFRFYPGLTNDMQSTGRIAILRTGQNFSFAIPKSKVTISTPVIYRHYVYNEETRAKHFASPLEDRPDDYRIEFYPTIEYQISDSFQASVTYDMYTGHKIGDGEILNFTNIGTYLEPAVNWDITKNIAFNPYVDIKTGNHINMDTTQWGMNLILTLL